MKRASLFLVLASLLLLPTLPAAAQNQPGQLSVAYHIRVKMDSALKFETALKQHVAWLGQQNETWSWNVWQKVMGPNLNEYVIYSPGHTLQDLDSHAAFDKANREHWLANVAQFTTYVSGGIFRYRSDISRPPAGTTTPALVMVFLQQFKPGSEEKFNDFARKVDAAIKKTNWPIHYVWEEIFNGTSAPMAALLVPGANWASFKPPDKSSRAMLEEAYGREEADSLLHAWDEIIVNESSYTFMYRPDLSYKPAR